MCIAVPINPALSAKPRAVTGIGHSGKTALPSNPFRNNGLSIGDYFEVVIVTGRLRITMKVFISKVKSCRDCPASSRRITSGSRSEPVCELFMDDKEPGRRGRVMDNDTYNFSIPSWCPLDNMIEDEDAEYVITANNQQKDPRFEYSRIHEYIIKWRDII